MVAVVLLVPTPAAIAVHQVLRSRAILSQVREWPQTNKKHFFTQ